MDGRLHGNDVRFEAVVTDSRRVARGDCFFALSGPRFDAHQFVEQVADAGAALAVVISLGSVGWNMTFSSR